ncbi:hypothetical protein SALBM135S_01218 [Streptomyces alboniger]
MPRLGAGAAGLLAMLVSALLGTAVGALTNWPLLRSAGKAVPAMLLGALLLLVTTGSPAKSVLVDLRSGAVGVVVGHTAGSRAARNARSTPRPRGADLLRDPDEPVAARPVLGDARAQGTFRGGGRAAGAVHDDD